MIDDHRPTTEPDTPSPITDTQSIKINSSAPAQLNRAPEWTPGNRPRAPHTRLRALRIGLGIAREDQELHEGCSEPCRETTNGEVVAIDCVDGVELECSTPPRAEKLRTDEAGHRLTSRRSRTVKSSVIR
jgi:hypothetical protein